MKRSIAVAFLLSAFGSAEAKEADKLCKQLRTFESAVLQTGSKGGDSIEIFWDDDDEAMFSVACSAGTPAARSFCSSTPGNISMEFEGLFPQRILKCYSIKSAAYDLDGFHQQEFKFATKARSTVVLRTDYLLPPDGKPWLRLAIFPKGSKVFASSLPDPRSYKEDEEQ